MYERYPLKMVWLTFRTNRRPQFAKMVLVYQRPLIDLPILKIGDFQWTVSLPEGTVNDQNVRHQHVTHEQDCEKFDMLRWCDAQAHQVPNFMMAEVGGQRWYFLLRMWLPQVQLAHDFHIRFNIATGPERMKMPGMIDFWLFELPTKLPWAAQLCELKRENMGKSIHTASKRS